MRSSPHTIRPPSAMLRGLVGIASAASLPSAVAKCAFSVSRIADGFFALTADMIESRIARAATVRSPGKRAAASRASPRKPTASWYSSDEMRRPFSSTPFLYSSTATLTMFATR